VAPADGQRQTIERRIRRKTRLGHPSARRNFRRNLAFKKLLHPNSVKNA